MLVIAWRNLLHDPVRLAATLLGVTFAVVLMTAQVGVYLGFMTSASQFIDHVGADLWMVNRGTVNFDSAWPFPQRKLQRAKAVPGVVRTAELVHAWGFLKVPTGRTELVQMVGFDPRTGVGGPWRMREGRIADLAVGDGFVVDASFRERLDGMQIGDDAEYHYRATTLVGISEDVSSLTTYPIIFSSLDTARRLSRYIPPDEISYGLIWLDPDLDPAGRAAAIEQLSAIPGVDVLPESEYSHMTRMYWTFETGIGIAFGVAILLGFLVGIVIVAQTLYAATVAHLREYGTLKAIGARNADLYRIIVLQAVISGVIGYAAGTAITVLVVRTYIQLGVKVETGPELLGVMFVVTTAMCLLASVVSIRRITRIEPGMAFRG